jgi:hypothetical protein
VPKRQPMQPDAPSQTCSSLLLCVCVCARARLSLSLSLFLCLFDAEAKRRRGRWHRAPLRQLLQCSMQVGLWLALACVRNVSLCDCERLFRHFVKNILKVKYVVVNSLYFKT